MPQDSNSQTREMPVMLLWKSGGIWQTGLRSAIVAAVVIMGTNACDADKSTNKPHGGQAPQSAQATSTPDRERKLDAPVAKGLASLTSGNLTQLAFYDPSTGKETFSTTLPQYSEKNPWKRHSFSSDWKRHAWVKDGGLFSSARPSCSYGPIRTGPGRAGPVEDDGVADRVGVADGSAELVGEGDLGAGEVTDVAAGENA
ncbi:hypothetical protein ACIQZO_37665 [Streptomyces sp. NPDC097617]|uniref:hypothetical protein n=1 Tax=Streptomyces sp. NPDC097617 TaxID=3366091 RepID=UPI00381DCB09